MRGLWLAGWLAGLGCGARARQRPSRLLSALVGSFWRDSKRIWLFVFELDRRKTAQQQQEPWQIGGAKNHNAPPKPAVHQTGRQRTDWVGAGWLGGWKQRLGLGLGAAAQPSPAQPKARFAQHRPANATLRSSAAAAAGRAWLRAGRALLGSSLARPSPLSESQLAADARWARLSSRRDADLSKALARFSSLEAP